MAGSVLALPSIELIAGTVMRWSGAYFAQSWGNFRFLGGFDEGDFFVGEAVEAVDDLVDELVGAGEAVLEGGVAGIGYKKISPTT